LKQAKSLRIAIVDREKCKSTECNFECNRFCPIVRGGNNIVWLDEEGKAVIDEIGCIACGICVVKCPFHAIEIVNLASEPNVPCIHQYGINSFRIYGLPTPKYGKAVGVIGMNGAGKTTALNILAGKIKPNLGILDREVNIDEIIERFKGKEIQRYLKDLYDKKIKVIVKPQDIHSIVNIIKGEVKNILQFVNERGDLDLVLEFLSLNNILNKNVKELSGGELQRFAIAIAALKDGDVYLFDEPCSYLDVHQRLKLAKLLNYLLSKGKTLVLVEHDFAVLDYLCENVCIIYGKPKVYGIVSLPYSTSEGINSYLDGYLPHENVRIRKTPVKFLLRSLERQEMEGYKFLGWSRLLINLGNFTLEVEEGYINKGEVIGILGPNGIGKTTFIKVLAGEIQPLEGSVYFFGEKPTISYKPQVFTFNQSEILVKDYLNQINRDYSKDEWVMEEIIYPLRIDQIYERYIHELSGGEKQALKITECLLKDADIYLFDEPSAFLDVEQRLAVAKILRKYAQTFKKSIFIVEHDLIIQDFACDGLIIFRGEPGLKGHAYEPLGLKKGFNLFLKDLGITFRRDQKSLRPRINKEGSWLDRKQKELGEYYYFNV